MYVVIFVQRMLDMLRTKQPAIISKLLVVSEVVSH